MVSAYAMEDVERMEAEGLKPAPADIIRLNALGCRVERGEHDEGLSTMPRCAFVGDLVFREPTIGSEIWIADVSRQFDMENAETLLLVRAYALARDQKDLPDALDAAAVKAEVERFKREKLAAMTVRELVAAVGYAMHGNGAAALEFAEEDRGSGGSPDATSSRTCVELGLLYRGMAMRLGSAAELKALTSSTLDEMILLAIDRDDRIEIRKEEHARFEGEYLRTLGAIRKRLEGEKSRDDKAQDYSCQNEQYHVNPTGDDD